MKNSAQPAPQKARVFVVDDHPIVRRAFEMLLALEADLSICGEAECSAEALEKIPKLMPDVVVVDISLKGSSGLDLVRDLRAHCPGVKVLVFSMHDELYFAERVLRLGAHGYLTKEEGATKAVEAIRLIVRGRKFVSPRVACRIIDGIRPSGGVDMCSIDRLTVRELEVLQMIGSGLATRAIAQRLRLSVKTVECYRENIKSKLGLSNAAELVSYAFNWVLGADH